MDDPTFYIIMATAGLAAIAMIVVAGLKGYSAWIELKRAELVTHAPAEPVASNAGNRIEIADLKERLRKLEAIAAGVDL